jgi:hypothetical protein
MGLPIHDVWHDICQRNVESESLWEEGGGGGSEVSECFDSLFALFYC